MHDITQLLQSTDLSDPAASEQILPLVYQELRRHASLRMSRELGGQTLQATALVHEAWMRLSNDGSRQWQNRGHFFAAAAESMRRILIEKARRRSRIKHGGGLARVNIDDVEVASAESTDKLLKLDEALELLKRDNPERGQVVVLKFYLGLSDEEAAATLGVSVRTIARHWAYSKAWLFQHLSKN